MKKIKKSFWRAYWKLHDKKKMLVARLKGYLDGLPPKTRRRIVLAMLAAFAVLALYTFGKAGTATSQRAKSSWQSLFQKMSCALHANSYIHVGLKSKKKRQKHSLSAKHQTVNYE